MESQCHPISPVKPGTPLTVKTSLRAGVEETLFEKGFFALLDTLQKPTDWLYEKVCANHNSAH